MFKILITLIFLVSFVYSNAQVESIPNDFKPPKSDDNKRPGGLNDKGYKAFNNINHPLSITGGALTIAGAALYVVGSERLGKQPIDDPFIESYSPQTPLQYIGIGVFATGAVLFAIFSTERDVPAPKRKRNKNYNATDWEIASE